MTGRNGTGREASTRVVVVGAGFGGIAAAIELREHGITDVVILDSAPEIGGTWYYNSYPGAACDVPSHLYSFSFAQRSDWSRLCSPQPEILEYLQGVAKEYGLGEVFVPDVRVDAVRLDEASMTWTVEAQDGRRWEADAVVLATGQLNTPAIPPIPGAADFAGPAMHSARWDHDVDLRGKRVAVVGTGASAVQFVPAIAPEVGSMTVFQRSGNWFFPRKNRHYPPAMRRLFRRVPGIMRTRRFLLKGYLEFLTIMIRHPSTVGRLGRVYSTLFMRRQLRDPEVRRKAWPDYTFGCKRILFSSHYLPALERDNVELVTDRVTEIVPDGVRTEDGRHHPADVLIWGTGFKSTDFMFPMEIVGRGGRTLQEEWSQGAHAHLGMTVPGFPSLFVLYGPNTNTSGGSIIVFLEAQVAYVRQALEETERRRAAALEVRRDVEQAFDERLQAEFEGTAWTQCDSWYRDESGRIVANWPRYMEEYVRAVAKLDPTDYEFIPR
ncbi:flavin-containing monooxygenase [Actinomycetospora lemnae]|uniref:NAD(P)/FAD-dependent oxidoreductase n=1 Tax=Actinomycetospora lemnae TaxID=3019891 RepID=A0ABT5SW42_9PSEU|nr:NAD(P)/FAD-dependent oxidoreductase [Actinomycetospora sp. DW7H6]MDD7966212.1 NAD(P)/FAD-dependent oxidoreductase [Actinomycetospora sp. DW7H6]